MNRSEELNQAEIEIARILECLQDKGITVSNVEILSNKTWHEYGLKLSKIKISIRAQ